MKEGQGPRPRREEGAENMGSEAALSDMKCVHRQGVDAGFKTSLALRL